MKVAVIGGGPAGLYFALLLKKADAAHSVTVVERNRLTTRSAGASCSPTRRWRTSGRRRRTFDRSPRTSRTGTTSTSTFKAANHIGRSRLQRASRARSFCRFCRSARAGARRDAPLPDGVPDERDLAALGSVTPI